MSQDQLKLVERAIADAKGHLKTYGVLVDAFDADGGAATAEPSFGPVELIVRGPDNVAGPPIDVMQIGVSIPGQRKSVLQPLINHQAHCYRNKLREAHEALGALLAEATAATQNQNPK